jgi:hypothetical protein
MIFFTLAFLAGIHGHRQQASILVLRMRIASLRFFSLGLEIKSEYQH